MMRHQGSVRVAVNVMRARLTVVGFNLAVITFQLNAVPRLPGAVPLAGIGTEVHLSTDITLMLGIALSTLAMICFIVSSAFDEQGSCNHWTLLAGDIFMYLGLAHTVAGFSIPYLQVLESIASSPPDASASLATVQTALLVSGGVSWLAAAYVGPAVSLLRSPFGRARTLAIAVAYLAMVLALAHVRVEVLRFEAAHIGGDTSAFSIPGELVLPLRW